MIFLDFLYVTIIVCDIVHVLLDFLMITFFKSPARPHPSLLKAACRPMDNSLNMADVVKGDIKI